MGGSAAWRRSPPTASRVRSNGASSGSPISICPPGDPRRALQDWGEATVARSDEFYAVTPADDYVADGRHAHVHERDRDAASREQHRSRALLPRSLAARPEARGARDGAVELRRRGARRAVPAAQPVRHLGAAPEPSLSRRAHAARAHARRLHRQRQRRPDGAGLPAGGARRAARHRLAARAGLRIDRRSSAPASAPAWRC